MSIFMVIQLESEQNGEDTFALFVLYNTVIQLDSFPCEFDLYRMFQHVLFFRKKGGRGE